MDDIQTANELVELAKNDMLGGREPETEDDWILVFNFLAVTFAGDAFSSRSEGCVYINHVLGSPICDDWVKEIARFHDFDCEVN